MTKASLDLTPYAFISLVFIIGFCFVVAVEEYGFTALQLELFFVNLEDMSQTWQIWKLIPRIICRYRLEEICEDLNRKPKSRKKVVAEILNENYSTLSVTWLLATFDTVNTASVVFSICCFVNFQLVSCAEGEVIFWDYSDGRILKVTKIAITTAYLHNGCFLLTSFS